MFSAKAIVVDEVHNLVSLTVNERKIGMLLYNQLLKSKTVR